MRREPGGDGVGRDLRQEARADRQQGGEAELQLGHQPRELGVLQQAAGAGSRVRVSVSFSILSHAVLPGGENREDGAGVGVRTRGHQPRELEQQLSALQGHRGEGGSGRCVGDLAQFEHCARALGSVQFVTDER